MDGITPGNWEPGKVDGTVVTNIVIHRNAVFGWADYGGHMIAESIRRQADVLGIAALPELLDACQSAVKNHLPYEDESGYVRITLQDYAKILNAIAKAKAEGKA